MKKKGLSLKRKTLAIALIIAIVFSSIGTSVSAAEKSYTEPSDLSEGKMFDFDNNNILYSSSQLIDGTSINISDSSTLETQQTMRVAGWGWSIKDDGTGNKVFRAGKKDSTTYSTAGAVRLNDNGEFCNLKPAQSYYVSIKYKVLSTHVLFTKNSTTYPSEAAVSSLLIGYDSRIGNDVNSGARMASIKTVLATLVKANNTQGSFKSIDEFGVETTKNVGEWYTEEIYFTTPDAFESYSQHFAICATSYNGFDVMVDDIYIKEVPTVSLELNGGSGIETTQPALVGAKVELSTPSREGYSFGGWYKDAALTQPFTDTVYTEENCNIKLYAKWNKDFNVYTADFFNYDGVLTDTNHTSNNFSIISNGTPDKTNRLWFNGRTAISSINRAYFPLANDDGIIKVKSNTTYAVLVDYAMHCEMSGSKYKLRILSASATDINDGAVTLFDEEVPSGDYRHYVSFETGDIAEGKDSLYIEISYKNSNVVEVWFNKLKIVQIDDGMSFLRAYDSFSYTTYDYLGYTGESLDLPEFQSTSSYKFDGWYTDQTYVTKHNEKFSDEKLAFAYSYWENQLETFEEFVPPLNDSYTTIGDDIEIIRSGESYEGEKMLKYSYKYAPNYFVGSHNAASLAVVYDKTTYKISFKYKIDKAVDDVQFKFFTAQRTTRWCYITNYDEATYTAYNTEVGEGWKEAVVYITTDFVKAEHSDGLFLSFNPVVEGETVVCIDNFDVQTVKADKGVVAFLGKDEKGGFYSVANVGTTVNAPTEQLTEYFSSFLGWYVDKECTVKFNSTTVKPGITYIYSKWADTSEDFEGYPYVNEKIVNESGNNVLKNGEAKLGSVKSNTTYLVEYKFKTSVANTSVYLKTANAAYNEEGSLLTVPASLANGKWHSVKKYISTSDISADSMLYAVAQGDICVDDISIREVDVVFDKGSSVLTPENEEAVGSQAMRFYFSYKSENGATVKVDGQELTLVERGIVLKNAGNDQELTVSNASNGNNGLLLKKKTYGFGTYWSYDSVGASNFVAKYATYPKNVKASTEFKQYVALPSLSAESDEYSNYIRATNGYLAKELVADGTNVCTKLYNRQTWGAKDVLVLADENGAAIQIKNGTSYDITLTYKVPHFENNISLEVVAGLRYENRLAVPAGTETKDTVLTVVNPNTETKTDPKFEYFGWAYNWSGSGHYLYGVTGASDTWQTVTYSFTTNDLTGYLPVLMLSIGMGSTNNGVSSEILIKDITVAESGVEKQEIVEYIDGIKASGEVIDGVLNPNTMPGVDAPEGAYFAGWADNNGNFVLKNGVEVECGEVVYSYYLTDFYKSDVRNVTARGYIKAKDGDGNVYTFYSSTKTECVNDVKAISAEVTDKKVHTINERNWNRYTIVNPKVMPYIYGRQIENLIEYAAGRGVTLQRVNEKAAVTPYEIIIGDTTREESSLVSVENEDEYVISVKGNKVIIKGGSDIATAQGVEDLISYLKFKDALGCGADLYDGFELRGKYEAASDKYVLTYLEDFDTLDKTRWASYAGYDYGNFYGESILGGSYGNRSTSGREVLTKSGEMKNLVTVRDGNLALGSAWVTPIDEKDIEMNVEFMHANLSTFYTMLYKYGMLEIRSDVADVPSTTSFWINGAGGMPGQRTSCATEYDLIENYGRTNYYASAIHHWSTNETTGNLDHFGPPSENFTGNMEQSYKPDIDENGIYDSYHIYTFVWEEDKIIFAFDGVKYAEYDIVDWYRENMANCIILSSGLGDACYGAAFNPEIHTDYYETLIDYIKIYQIEDMGSEIIWKN